MQTNWLILNVSHQEGPLKIIYGDDSKIQVISERNRMNELDRSIIGLILNGSHFVTRLGYVVLA